MNRPGVRHAAAVLAVLAAVVGLSGCFKAQQDIEIKGDGTGSVDLHFELNKKAVEAIARSFGDPAVLGGPGTTSEPFKSIDRTFPDGTEVRTANTPDRATLDASFDFNGPDDYARRLQQVGEAVATDPDDSLPVDGAIVIRRIDDRMEVTLDVGSSTQGMEDFDVSELRGLVDPAAIPSVVVTITMPGEILSSNGQAKGRTVTWDLLSQRAPSTLAVVSEVDSPGLPGWALPAAAGLLLVLLLAILAVLLGQRRRSRTVGPVAAPYPPSPWPPTDGTGGATFFPPPSSVPSGQPVGWSQQQPAPGPPGGAHSWLQSGQAPAGPASGGAPPPSGPPPPTGPWPGQGPPSGGAAVPPGAPPWQAPPPAGGFAVPGSPTGPPTPPPSNPAPQGARGPGEAPAREPSEPVPWPPSPGVASPSAPAPPEPPRQEHEDAPAAQQPDPLPWRVPGGAADPAPAAPPTEPEATAPVPVPPVAVAEPGWYPDPAGGPGARYWDGRQWTEHTR